MGSVNGKVVSVKDPNNYQINSLGVFSGNDPVKNRGFAKGISRTVSPRFFLKMKRKKREKTENGRKRKNRNPKKKAEKEKNGNGKNRKKTEKIGSDTVPATPFAKSRSRIAGNNSLRFFSGR